MKTAQGKGHKAPAGPAREERKKLYYIKSIQESERIYNKGIPI